MYVYPSGQPVAPAQQITASQAIAAGQTIAAGQAIAASQALAAGQGSQQLPGSQVVGLGPPLYPGGGVMQYVSLPSQPQYQVNEL